LKEVVNLEAFLMYRTLFTVGLFLRMLHLVERYKEALTDVQEACSDVACVIYTRKEVVAKEAIIVVFISPEAS
jgi:hypothetical protein